MLLAWLSGAFIGGVAVGAVMPAEPGIAAGAGIVLAASGLIRRSARWSSLLLILGAAAVGIARAPHPEAATPGSLAFYEGRYVQIHGVVDSEPDIRTTGVNYSIAVDHLTVRGVAHPVSGRLVLRTARAVELEFGTDVLATGRLRHVARSPFGGSGSTMRYPRLRVGSVHASGWLAWLHTLRHHLQDGIDQWLPEPEAALLVAITLGARSSSLGDLAPALVSTGLIHLVAISGIKVAMVAGTVHEILRRVAGRMVVLFASLSVLAGYLILTGNTPSGQRSAIMWALVFVASYLGRNTVTLVSLGFAAAIMVALQPDLLWDIGFLMSVTGTLAIVALAPALVRLFRFVPSPLREALATTLAAQFGTLPLVLTGFGMVSLSGPLANMLVLPLLPALIALGFAIGASAGVVWLAAPLAGLGYSLLHMVVLISEALATTPSTVSGTLSVPASVAYYGLVAVVTVVLLRQARWTPERSFHGVRREVVLAVAAACSVLTLSLATARADTRTRLYWLGTGDAFLLRTDGRSVLIGGSPDGLGVLERLGQVLPYGDRQIDAMLVTDARSSNVSSLRDVAARYSVPAVLDVGTQYPSQTYSRFRADLRASGTPAYVLRTGVALTVGRVTVSALGPDGVCAVAADCDALLRVSTESGTMVLTGSASLREQSEAVFRNVRLRADALVCGTSGCSSVLVRAVQPRRIYSAGLLPHNASVTQLSPDSMTALAF